MLLSKKKAQSLSEYVILLALAASAVTAMHYYVTRGMQGRLRDASDFVVDSANRRLGSGYANQYEPYYLDSWRDLSRNAMQNDQMFVGGGVEQNIIYDRENVLQGTETR